MGRTNRSEQRRMRQMLDDISSGDYIFHFRYVVAHNQSSVVYLLLHLTLPFFLFWCNLGLRLV
jgi:hypothetical protein